MPYLSPVLYARAGMQVSVNGTDSPAILPPPRRPKGVAALDCDHCPQILQMPRGEAAVLVARSLPRTEESTMQIQVRLIFIWNELNSKVMMPRFLPLWTQISSVLLDGDEICFESHGNEYSLKYNRETTFTKVVWTANERGFKDTVKLRTMDAWVYPEGMPMKNASDV